MSDDERKTDYNSDFEEEIIPPMVSSESIIDAIERAAVALTSSNPPMLSSETIDADDFVWAPLSVVPPVISSESIDVDAIERAAVALSVNPPMLSSETIDADAFVWPVVSSDVIPPMVSSEDIEREDNEVTVYYEVDDERPDLELFYSYTPSSGIYANYRGWELVETFCDVCDASDNDDLDTALVAETERQFFMRFIRNFLFIILIFSCFFLFSKPLDAIVHCMLVAAFSPTFNSLLGIPLFDPEDIQQLF